MLKKIIWISLAVLFVASGLYGKVVTRKYDTLEGKAVSKTVRIIDQAGSALSFEQISINEAEPTNALIYVLTSDAYSNVKTLNISVDGKTFTLTDNAPKQVMLPPRAKGFSVNGIGFATAVARAQETLRFPVNAALFEALQNATTISVEHPTDKSLKVAKPKHLKGLAQMITVKAKK
jgi:hypothetical protein